ncbi:alpha/beta fold hydrolase [Enterococcus sp. LJL90]
MQINFKELGEGTPIYFIHGNGLNIDSMMCFYERLFTEQYRNYHRIYIDIPGMGDSDFDDTIQNSDDILTQIIEFIYQKTGNETFLLCGHSYGGYLCLGIGTKLSAQAKGIFLTCPVVKAAKKDRSLEKHTNIIEESIDPKRNLDYFQDFMDMNVMINKQAWNDYQDAIIPGIKKETNDFWEEIEDDAYSFSFEKVLEENLPEMHGTILLGQYDQVVGYHDQLSFFESLSEIKSYVVDNSGHNLPIDQRKTLKEEFDLFLSSNQSNLT